MNSIWSECAFDQAIIRNSIGRKNQVTTSEYKAYGSYPIIDQGQTFIAGYTDDKSKVVSINLPYIIFGDHTRCFKYVDFPFVLGADGTKVIKPNQEIFNARFFYFALLALNIASRGYNRHFKLLQEKKLPRPILDEQNQIARVLATVQRAIEQQQAIIATTRELKRSLMHKLFTEGLHGEPQKQTEIGWVPESWEANTLGALANCGQGAIQTGPFGSQLHKDEYQNAGTPVINPTHLIGNKINYSGLPMVEPDVVDRLSRHIVKTGDILFARRGEIGRHGLVTDNEAGWLCGTGCFLVRVRHPDVDNRFLYYYCSLNGVVRWLNSHAAGAIMPNLNNTVLQRMPVFLPDRKDQELIADSIELLDQKIELAEKKLGYFSDLFKTLLHELMTAQIRVHDLDLDALGVPALD